MSATEAEDGRSMRIMYFRSGMESRKAAFTMDRKALGARDFRYAAFSGVVDHTKVAWLLGRGSRAIGPPSDGRKR